MPIAAENTRLSIDFAYEYETPDSEVLRYQMKFQHTTQGPIVTISQGPYEPVELPADMFTEVAEFLISQGVVKGAKPVTLGHASKVGSLAIPSINKARRPLIEPKPEPVQAITQAQVEADDADEKSEEVAAVMAEREAAKARAAKAKKPFHSAHKPKE